MLDNFGQDIKKIYECKKRKIGQKCCNFIILQKTK